MVLQPRVDALVTQQMLDETLPLLPHLHDYTAIQQDPQVLLLRNPRISPDAYEQWQKDHRFGRFTCPGSSNRAWKKGGGIDKIVLRQNLVDKHLVCVSAMIILYNGPKDVVSFHRDPSKYVGIVSLTLQGSGVMLLKDGRSVVSYELVPGKAVVLDEDDCLHKKHSVCSKNRLGLVLRYISP